MTTVLDVLNFFAVLFFVLFGMGLHTWWQADRSKNNPHTLSNSIKEYLTKYAPIIAIRAFFVIMIFGIWWKNPNAVSGIVSMLSSKAHSIGWEKIAVILSFFDLSPKNIFMGGMFGMFQDFFLYYLARYVPGFKTAVPDLPISIINAEEAAKPLPPKSEDN